MKTFLSADMEGTCGIVSWPETERAAPMDYTPAQQQMTCGAAAAEAVKRASQCQAPMPGRFHMEIDFFKHHVAYSKSFYPVAALKDSKFVCFDAGDWYEMPRFCHFVLNDG